jgi:hypothetical protein
VAKFATHSNPVERPVPSFMLQARLSDVGADGHNFEQMWSKRVGEDLFEVCCIPFFAYDLALGDVVRADPSGDCVIQSVERRSGNGLVRVAVKRPEDLEAMHVRLHDLIGRLEYLCEWFAPGYVAVNLEPDRIHDELFAGLTALGEAVEVERILV